MRDRDSIIIAEIQELIRKQEWYQEIDIANMQRGEASGENRDYLRGVINMRRRIIASLENIANKGL